eukprot:scaffold36296_cov119-Isochrysis_galbana.AAC.3
MGVLLWEGVFGAAQNVGRFWRRHPARLLWASGGHPRGQSRLIWVRQGPWVPYVEQAGHPYGLYSPAVPEETVEENVLFELNTDGVSLYSPIEERADDVFEGDSESGRSGSHHTPSPPPVSGQPLHTCGLEVSVAEQAAHDGACAN